MKKFLIGSTIALLCFGSIQDTLGYGRGSASRKSFKANTSSTATNNADTNKNGSSFDSVSAPSTENPDINAEESSLYSDNTDNSSNIKLDIDTEEDSVSSDGTDSFPVVNGPKFNKNLAPTAADTGLVNRFKATKIALQNVFANPKTLASWLESYCKLIGRKKNPLTNKKISNEEAKQLRLWVNLLKVAGDFGKSSSKVASLKKIWSVSSISSGPFTEFVMPYIADSLGTIADIDAEAREAYVIAKTIVLNDKEVSKSR